MSVRAVGTIGDTKTSNDRAILPVSLLGLRSAGVLAFCADSAYVECSRKGAVEGVTAVAAGAPLAGGGRLINMGGARFVEPAQFCGVSVVRETTLGGHDERTRGQREQRERDDGGATLGQRRS